MSSDIVVRASGISKSYRLYNHPSDRLKELLLLGRKRMHRNFQALQEVSFDVKRGESIGIVGINGSGKSTLLQIICGTLRASTGSMQTHGRICALLELGSGFNHEFTGEENIRLYAAVLGMSPHQIQQQYDSILAFADIGDFIHQPLKTYSSGMVVRLAFAAAVHAQPDILVVDEALSVGDMAFQQKCLAKIRQLQAGGVSIVLVSHSGNTIIEYCDRAIYLDHGRLMMDGSCDEVMKRYALDTVEREKRTLATIPRTTAKASVTNVPPTQSVHKPDLALAIRAAQILNTKHMPCESFAHAEHLSIRVEVQINEIITRPCFGIQITSTDGIVLWSATTENLQIKLGELSPGIQTFTWKIQALMGSSHYVVSIGGGQITDGQYYRSDRLEYAGHFDVLPQSNAGSGWLSISPKFDCIIQS